jgi:glycosyltransferase involved in cell wall biosynthesis
MKKKVSIVMPAYNSEQYIAQAILSVQNQTYFNWELIIIDDGSTDDTPNIIDKWSKADSRILHRRIDNSGKPSIARNIGIGQSSGHLICFLDSDDFMARTRLEDQIKCFHDQKLDLCFHDIGLVDRKENILSNTYLSQVDFLNRSKSTLVKNGDHYSCVNEFYNFTCIEILPIHTNSIMIKSCLLDEFEPEYFNPSLTIGEDSDLWYRLIVKSEKIIFIDKVLSYYRDNSESITKNTTLRHLGFINTHILNFFRAKKILHEQELNKYKENISKECCHLAYTYSQRNNLWLSYTYYSKGFYWYPSLKNFIQIPKATLSWLKSKFLYRV